MQNLEESLCLYLDLQFPEPSLPMMLNCSLLKLYQGKEVEEEQVRELKKILTTMVEKGKSHLLENVIVTPLFRQIHIYCTILFQFLLTPEFLMVSSFGKTHCYPFGDYIGFYDSLSEQF